MQICCPDKPDEAWAPLIDLSGRNVELVRLTDDSPTGRCLRRVLASLDNPDAVISAFGSFAAETEVCD